LALAIADGHDLGQMQGRALLCSTTIVNPHHHLCQIVAFPYSEQDFCRDFLENGGSIGESRCHVWASDGY
jgi:hypothetical protein